MSREPLCDVGIPSLETDNFTHDHFLKIERLFVDVTVVKGPDRGKSDIFGMI